MAGVVVAECVNGGVDAIVRCIETDLHQLPVVGPLTLEGLDFAANRVEVNQLSHQNSNLGGRRLVHEKDTTRIRYSSQLFFVAHNLLLKMQINPSEVAYKKQVGTLDGSPVMEIGLKGGLHLILATRKGKVETLGVGPHRAVARHIAKKREKELAWTELAKGDHINPEHFAFCLPEYEALTDDFRMRSGF